ncbi:MAG: LysM peptidoglycan-binding domain-containing protein [Verrucomicrobia bacterium]|nr:LysM peptidoglycan-binding domain-containing protein [Verrucomicrobiota bacterium]
MNRRDTILVAVLINMGLLVILFATAVSREKTEKRAPIAALPLEAPKVEVVVKEPVRQLYVVQDEMDQVLQAYTAAPNNASEEPQPQPLTTVAPAPLPSPQIQPSVPDKNEYFQVIVKRGDNLDKIAKANGTSVESLIESNELKSTVLQIGQVLRVPVRAPADERSSLRRRISTNTAAAAEGENFYTIQSGDNPWVIAMKYHIPLEELLALNHLDETSARKLKPGDKIRVR